MPNQDNYVSEVHERRKKRRFYFFSTIILTLIYAVIVGAISTVLRSPLFHLQKITITGNETVVDSDILSLLQSHVVRSEPIKALLGFNNILIWPDELGAGDLIFLPSIKSFKVEKNYRERSVLVTVEERRPIGIWCFVKPQTDAESYCWWFDDEGVIFKRAIAAQGSLIVTVNDYSQAGSGLNSKILPSDFIPSILSIFHVLQASSLNIQEIRLRDLALQELEAATYNGPIIYFSLRFPAENARAVIENFLAKPGFSKLQYLDFRVENRVYYK